MTDTTTFIKKNRIRELRDWVTEKSSSPDKYFAITYSEFKFLVQEQQTQLVREFLEDFSNIKMNDFSMLHLAGFWANEDEINKLVDKYSSLLPNNKETE
jgi:hypothetical protein